LVDTPLNFSKDVSILTKVLHLPTPVGGNAWALSQGEKSLGLDSHVLYTTENPFRYPSDFRFSPFRGKKSTLNVLKKAALFLKIRKTYDVFHFNFGRSIFHRPEYLIYHEDLPWYSKKARLFVTYNGCDARQKYPTRVRRRISACIEDGCYDGICNSGRQDAYKRHAISKMARHVKHMWALNPDLLHFLPQEKSSFCPYAVELDNIRPGFSDYSKKTLHVVHAPTNRACKGSDMILNALESVKRKHPGLLEIHLVENLEHKRAMEVYRKADLVIDQVLVGWYGAFAVEVMGMGKPVICRIEEEDLRFIPEDMRAHLKEAMISSDPSSLEKVITRCLQDRSYLKERAQACLEYARKWHRPKHVAMLTKEKYEL
jgi:hypothetical protein